MKKPYQTETSAMENVNNKLIKYKVEDILSHDQSLKDMVWYVIIVWRGRNMCFEISPTFPNL